MQITTKKIFTKQEDGTYLGHDAYRLTKSYRDSDGKERKTHVLYLGRLEGLTRQDRKELAWMLNPDQIPSMAVIYGSQVAIGEFISVLIGWLLLPMLKRIEAFRETNPKE